MAYKQFLPAQVLTASEAQTYLMNQSVMVFATSAARTSALTAPSEGMTVYLQDSNSFEFYDGSAWVNLGNVMRFASSVIRATILTSPVEGMVCYLQDTDELQVYNGSSWLTVVVTSDDEGFTTSGAVTAANGGQDGGIALRTWTGNSGFVSLATRDMAGSEYMMISDGSNTLISGGTGGVVYLRPNANDATGSMSISTTTTQTSGNVTISKRNPVLQIEETGGADNVDINLYQSGSSTEGLQIRYESGTGHSRIKNIYSLGNLYLHSANNTSAGMYVDKEGTPRYIQKPNVYG